MNRIAYRSFSVVRMRLAKVASTVELGDENALLTPDI